MKILHTSDWHLGQQFFDYDRTAEQQDMLRQVAAIVRDEQPDAMVVSGDVFHTGNPSPRVVEMYNRALLDMREACPAMQIVVTAGNHDSASRLVVNNDLWDYFRVSIVGHVARLSDENRTPDLDKHIIKVYSGDGELKGLIAAVPYSIPSTGWSNLGSASVGEVRVGASSFIQSLLDHARAMGNGALPVVLMAHTAVSGCDLAGHDNVGGMEMRSVDALGQGYDYAALGHIHTPQSINERARYCGTPIPVNFGERFEHSVSIVTVEAGEVPVVETRAIKNLIPLRDFPTPLPPADAREADLDDKQRPLPFSEVLERLREYPDDHLCYMRLVVRVDESMTPLANILVAEATKGKRCRVCRIQAFSYKSEIEEAERATVRMTGHELSAKTPLEIADLFFKMKGLDLSDRQRAMIEYASQLPPDWDSMPSAWGSSPNSDKAGGGLRLRTLTINNIASIENATIDFAGGKLANQALFLICGPTGAGKTTILDAICLALFNNTPRIENSSTDIVDNMVDGDDKRRERVKDVLHLVRKNAVNASVMLTFEGNDGCDYKAVWRIYRSGQYKSGKEVSTFAKESIAERLRRGIIKEWTLTDAEGRVYDRVKDVAEKIVEVIKMDFNQFCKTTMLAQGDFTKFLSCDANDKADILEKLVGICKYSETGKVINQTTNTKKNDVEVLSKEVANLHFMADEEREAKQQEIASVEAEIRRIAEQRKEVEGKRRWIADSDKATAEEAQSREALQNAEQALQSDHVRHQQQAIDLWDKTTEVREALAVRIRGERESIEQEEKQRQLAGVYAEAMAGLRFVSARLSALCEQNSALQATIDSQRQFEDMFANAGIICATQANIVSNEQFVAANMPMLKELDDKLVSMTMEKDNLDKQKQTAETSIKAFEQTAQTHKAALRTLGADTIDAEVAALNAHKTLVTETESVLRMWSEATTDFLNKQKASAQAQEALARLSAVEQEKRGLLAAATSQLKESRALYEKTKESISDHAKVLRAKLQQGDTCPVCGATVERVLTDEGFIAALLPLEQKYKDDEQKARALTDDYALAKANLAAGATTAANCEREATLAQQRLDGHTTTLGAKCCALDISIDAGDIAETLAATLAQMRSLDSETEASIAQRQASIKTIRIDIEAIEQQIAAIRRERINAIDKRLEQLQKEMEATAGMRSQKAGAVANAKSAIGKHRMELQRLINTEWKANDDARFFDELREAATSYANAMKAHAAGEATIMSLRQDMELMESCRDSVDQMFPEWSQHGMPTAQQVLGVSRMWANMLRDANALAEAMRSTQQAMAQALGVIDDFANTHADISIADVEALLLVPHADIVSARQRISRLIEDVSRHKALHDAALRRKAELPACPLAEGETAATLSGQAESLSQQEQDKAQAIGRLRSELDADARSRQVHGKKKTALDELRAEYAEWKTLDQYLGSTDGKNFRNVAQSFILSDLLDKANAYLANITGRYTLFCNPGTLTIMLRDSHQGGVVRTTNTLSGGESFIISLSLALGLSSMQSSGFAVDTLFIDEGFGTLSPEFLDPVIASLKRLYHTYGRRVGIISHVEALKAHIPVTIEVMRAGNSSSTVEVRET